MCQRKTKDRAILTGRTRDHALKGGNMENPTVTKMLYAVVLRET
jgi:hypothetical protein